MSIPNYSAGLKVIRRVRMESAKLTGSVKTPDGGSWKASAEANPDDPYEAFDLPGVKRRVQGKRPGGKFTDAFSGRERCRDAVEFLMGERDDDAIENELVDVDEALKA